MKSTFKIGHYTDKENITGCTVILCPPDTIASCYISGSAPGSREIALLDPTRKINAIHALLLTGGSAFGLNAAAGVVQYLEEKGIGNISRLPVSIRIMLESILRKCDGKRITEEDIINLKPLSEYVVKNLKQEALNHFSVSSSL